MRSAIAQRYLRRELPKMGKFMNAPLTKLALMIGFIIGFFAYTKSFAMAIVLVVGLYCHELGHAWAFKSSGSAVAGIWFIPGLAAVTVPVELPSTRWRRWLCCFMGPLAGFGSVLFLIAGNFACILIKFTWLDFPMRLLWAKCIFLLAVINLFNLMPLPLFDGWRMFEEVAHSSRVAYIVWGTFICGSVAYCAVFGHPWIGILIAMLGLAPLMANLHRDDPADPMSGAEAVLALFSHIILVVLFCAICVGFIELFGHVKFF